MAEWLDVFANVLQVGVLTVAYYYILTVLRGARSSQVLIGLVVLMAGLAGLIHLLHLDVLQFILNRILGVLAIAVVVIFQQEIRRALAELGSKTTFGIYQENRETIEAVIAAVLKLAEKKIGALIAIEREIRTRTIQESGVAIHTRLVPALLESIFYPHTPLHDGGVVIKGDQILAAGCIFPLSQNPEASKRIGTRHRAALGMSEETDAVVIVVSEETGNISTAYRGRLIPGNDEEKLRKFLTALLIPRRTGPRLPRLLPPRRHAAIHKTSATDAPHAQ